MSHSEMESSGHRVKISQATDPNTQYYVRNLEVNEVETETPNFQQDTIFQSHPTRN